MAASTAERTERRRTCEGRGPSGLRETPRPPCCPAVREVHPPPAGNSDGRGCRVGGGRGGQERAVRSSADSRGTRARRGAPAGIKARDRRPPTATHRPRRDALSRHLHTWQRTKQPH